MKTGIELIAEERQRQIEKEGWMPEHDDEHEKEELAKAAACYAIPDYLRYSSIGCYGKGMNIQRFLWDWDEEWWKPTPDNRIRELTKAGALIAAEIDRLQRKEGK